MNSVHLIGRLATDMEVKEVGEGSKVSSFILAVDRNAEEAGLAILRRQLSSLHTPVGVKKSERRSSGLRQLRFR